MCWSKRELEATKEFNTNITLTLYFNHFLMLKNKEFVIYNLFIITFLPGQCINRVSSFDLQI